MGNVAITYFSGRGHTRKLADKIAVALGQEGCAARLIDVTDLSQTDWQAMEAADAILLGAPTYMGSIAAEYKSFMDATSDIWSEQLWADKLAAGFTVATFPGGDKLSSLMQLNIFAMQHGMIWVGQDQIGAPVNADAEGINASGTWLGLAATTVRDKTLMVSQGDLETAHRFGQRIARAVRRWSI
ncbi:NAD(P)H dehydrogenase (quinone) [Thalassovita litoralis]|uniref:NAD(P)H dehydrogenase (Quinone) n=1 Tax=Thalassovita litoralis TaxID=1010611 RepID=A0A521CH58_9RHOB|nr:flavodoxin family protein [Thalassovita litoralis]SMO58797.1 NAD(P)H dehydrogenase (quinone) [Thalassovita litoralis]